MGTATIVEAPATGTTNDGGEDRLIHSIHRCGVEPILTRCGARPRPSYIPGEVLTRPATGIMCAVCEELAQQPCTRCEGH